MSKTISITIILIIYYMILRYDLILWSCYLSLCNLCHWLVSVLPLVRIRISIFKWILFIIFSSLDTIWGSLFRVLNCKLVNFRSIHQSWIFDFVSTNNKIKSTALQDSRLQNWKISSRFPSIANQNSYLGVSKLVKITNM